MSLKIQFADFAFSGTSASGYKDICLRERDERNLIESASWRDFFILHISRLKARDKLFSFTSHEMPQKTDKNVHISLFETYYPASVLSRTWRGRRGASLIIISISGRPEIVFSFISCSFLYQLLFFL